MYMRDGDQIYIWWRRQYEGRAWVRWGLHIFYGGLIGLAIGIHLAHWW